MGVINRTLINRVTRITMQPVGSNDLTLHPLLSFTRLAETLTYFQKLTVYVPFKELLLVDGVVYDVCVTFEILTLVDVNIKYWIATYMFQQLHYD
jgi:hypothetical protein